MDKNDIIARLENLNLDKTQYWVITGGAMVLYGLRERTHDIDLGCSIELADTLENQGHQTIIMEDGTRKIILEEDIEIFENWLYGEVVTLAGLPVISLSGLIEMKRALGREKDFRDIALIEDFLKEQNK